MKCFLGISDQVQAIAGFIFVFMKNWYKNQWPKFDIFLVKWMSPLIPFFFKNPFRCRTSCYLEGQGGASPFTEIRSFPKTLTTVNQAGFFMRNIG